MAFAKTIILDKHVGNLLLFLMKDLFEERNPHLLILPHEVKLLA